MKKPAIIDQEIEFTVISHAMLTPAQKVEDFNPERPAEASRQMASTSITTIV